ALISVGGWRVAPECFALLTALVPYPAAFTAEIVRGGIQAVPRGQWDAAKALGLRRSFVLKKIVLPQALRVIIPPMTSQYLNLTKNSSLAVAVGYQDIVSIANTTLNQTGQAIQAIALIMMVFLTISLGISFFMNWYNARLALVERRAMTVSSDIPVTPRTRVQRTFVGHAIVWLRTNLFATIPSTIITLLLLLVLGKGLISLLQWGWLNAVWSVPDANNTAACRAVRGLGACWAVI